MGVISMGGGVDCLFHALAFFDQYDGCALRCHVASFMEKQAQHQHGLETAWFCEAQQLHSKAPPSRLAITAYSLMTQTRVMVHTLSTAGQNATVEEVSHPLVCGAGAARMVHILYRNMNQYDALVELTTCTEGTAAHIPLTYPMPIDYWSLRAPIHSHPPAFIAEWTTQVDDDETAVTDAEREELIRMTGWLLQLLCMPRSGTSQLRIALRVWQAKLRQYFGCRLLPWPWSFVIYGMIL
jgi:hypothetical protein